MTLSLFWTSRIFHSERGRDFRTSRTSVSFCTFRLTPVFIDPLLTPCAPSPPLPDNFTAFYHQRCGAGRLSGLQFEQLSATQRALLIGSLGAVPLVQ